LPEDSNANLHVSKEIDNSENFDTTQRSYMKIQEIQDINFADERLPNKLQNASGIITMTGEMI
jgi:hypothetical protein